VLGGLTTQALPLQADSRSGMMHAIDALIGLIEQNGDGLKALYDARITLNVLLSMLISADAGGTRVAIGHPTNLPPVAHSS
jgi:hypothetical protein